MSGTSPETPREPQICSARSTTRHTASAVNALAIAVDCAPDRPWSSSQHAWRVRARAAAMSISESAIMPCAMPRSASREPNSSRLAARVSAICWARLAMPSQRMQCVIRAGPSRTCAYSYPLSTSPSTASSGTTQSSNTTSQWPPYRLSSRVEMCRTTFVPGFAASTRNMVAPPRSPGSPEVRAMQMVKPAPSAPVMNHLRPSIRQPPVTLVARVVSAAGSEPAPGAGSVIAKHERTSPCASGRR